MKTKNLRIVGLIAVTAVIIGLIAGITNMWVSKAAGEAAVIGHVNYSKLYSEFPAMKKAWEKVQATKTQLEQEMKAKLEGQDKDTQQKTYAQYNEKYNQVAKEYLDPAIASLNKAIADVARENGVNVVLDSLVVKFGGIDLTDKVMAKGGK